MHLMYVDESGDPGRTTYSSPHYILSGLIVGQHDWNRCLDRLKEYRRLLKATYNLNQRVEIHATELIRINEIESYRLIRKSDRVKILKDYCQQLPIIFDCGKVINICLKKDEFEGEHDFQLIAWRRLIERYDRYLKRVVKDNGIIISDDTDGHRVIQLLRKMRKYNPVASHFTDAPYNAPSDSIIEDIFSRSSHHSYFIQSVDIIAHLLYRREYPKGSLKKFQLERQFEKLEPILLKEASKTDPLGIVRK